MDSEKPALSDGYTRIVNDVMKAWPKARLSAYELAMCLAIAQRTFGFNKGKDRIAACQLAGDMEITRPKASKILNQLLRLNVVIREGGAHGPIKINTQTDKWLRPTKATRPPATSETYPITGQGDEKGTLYPIWVRNTYPNWGHTRDKRQSNSIPAEYSSDSVESTLAAEPETYSDSEIKGPPSTGKKPACPYRKIMDLYHQILPELSTVQVLSDKRKKQIRARWQSSIGTQEKNHCWSLDFWERYFTYVRSCPFLMGQGDVSPGRTTFFADLEWLTNASNFIKVIERRYESKKKESGHEKSGANTQSSRSELARQQTDIEYAIDNF